MEKGAQKEQSKAKLRYLTNPARYSVRKRNTCATQVSSNSRSWISKTGVANSPAEYSETYHLPTQDLKEPLLSNRFLNNQCLTEPSVREQISYVAESIPLNSLTINRKGESKAGPRYFCQERHDIIELSKWIAGKMDSLREKGKIDIEAFVDYRQFVVNVALTRLLGLIRKYSFEAAELMSELWSKTFGFMEFLLMLFAKDRRRQELAIATLEREKEELHVSYLERLKKQQQQLRDNLEHLKSDFKSSIVSGRQFKKKCSQQAKTLRQEKHRSKQFEEALIRSLHINMQFASGDNLQWSYRVFHTLYRSRNKPTNPSNGSDKPDDYSEEGADSIINRHLREMERQREGSKDWEQFDIGKENECQANGELEQLSVEKILELAAPKYVASSTTDLHPLNEIGIQTTVEFVHQTSNTLPVVNKQVGLQVCLGTKEQSTQTTKEPVVQFNRHKNRLTTSKIVRPTTINQAVINEVSSQHTSKESSQSAKSPNPSLQRQHQRQHQSQFVNDSDQGSFKVSRLNNSLVTTKLRLKKPESVYTTVMETHSEESTSFLQEEEQEKLEPLANFSQIYSSNKRKLLMNENKFKQKLMRKRSFCNADRAYKPVHRNRDIPYIDNYVSGRNRRQRQRYGRWGEDILSHEKFWQNVIRDVKQRLVTPASVPMATASLFRLFSQTIQSLSRAYKFNSTQPKIKSSKAPQRRHMHCLKYIIMRRLCDSMRMQSERELRQIVNNLLFLRRTKELEMFSMLMGLSQGYGEVGAIELELYVRTFALLDSTEKFQVQRELRTSTFLLSEKLDDITEGFFEPEEKEKLLQRLSRGDSPTLSVDQVARTLVRKYNERKRLSYDSYEYLFECAKHFGTAELKSLVCHLKLSPRVKSIMLRQFAKLLDCSTPKTRYISYERFWMFCERVQFPTRSVLLDFLRKESSRCKEVKQYCGESPDAIIQLLALHNIKICPLLVSIMNFMATCYNPTKNDFWANFLICFCSHEILEQKLKRVLPEEFSLLQAIEPNADCQ